MQTLDHELVQAPELEKPFRILLAFSGLRQALTTNPGYNLRVSECQEAAKVLLTYVQICLIHIYLHFRLFRFKFQWKCCKVYFSIACDTHFSASQDSHPSLDLLFLFSASGNSELEPTLCNGKKTLSVDFNLFVAC